MNATKGFVLQTLQNKNSPSKLRIAVINEFVPKLLNRQYRDVLFTSEELYTLMGEIEDISLFYEQHPTES